MRVTRSVPWPAPHEKASTRPVSGTVRRSTRDSASAPGLFFVDADTSPLGLGDATHGSQKCSCACSSSPQRAGRPAGRVWVRLTFPLALLFCFFARPPPGWVALVSFFFLFCACFLFFLRPPPLCPAFRAFEPGVPWALALVFPLPTPFSFFAPPPLRPPPELFVSGVSTLPVPSRASRVFRPGSPWALASCLSPPLPFFFFVAPPPPGFFLFARYSRVLVFFLRPRCLPRSVFSSSGCLGPWRLVSPPLPVFFAAPPGFCLPAFPGFFVAAFFRFVFVFLFLVLRPALLCWLCLPRPSGVLVRVAVVVMPGSGRCAFALCCSVCPGCACSLWCVVACQVARTWWRGAGGLFLPRLDPRAVAASGALLVCGAVPVPPLWCCAEVALLRRFLLCCFAFRLCVLCWSCRCGALPVVVRPILPPPPPRPAVRCLLSCCVAGCSGLACGAGCVLALPSLPSCWLWCPCGAESCDAAVRSVACFAFCLVLCGVLVLGWVLAPCCPAWYRAGTCCAVFVVFRCRVLLCSLLCSFLDVILCLPLVLPAVSVCLVLCGGACCCLTWLCRVVFLCLFLVRCTAWCSVVPWCVSWFCAACVVWCGVSVAFCLLSCRGRVLCSVLGCCAVLSCCAACDLGAVVPSAAFLATFAFVVPLVWCCAGVPASLLSVRCSRSPLALAGGVCCCLFLLGVHYWVWLSAVVSWWLLLACFSSALPVWPGGSLPCGLVWCVSVLCSPVLRPLVLCCRAVGGRHALLFVCVVACACCFFPPPFNTFATPI